MTLEAFLYKNDNCRKKYKFVPDSRLEEKLTSIRQGKYLIRVEFWHYSLQRCAYVTSDVIVFLAAGFLFDVASSKPVTSGLFCRTKYRFLHSSFFSMWFAFSFFPPVSFSRLQYGGLQEGKKSQHSTADRRSNDLRRKAERKRRKWTKKRKVLWKTREGK